MRYKVICNGKVSYHTQKETKKLIQEWGKENNDPIYLLDETWILRDTIYLNKI